MNETEQTFEVGDKVFDIVRGNGKVTAILNGTTQYPLEVTFQNKEHSKIHKTYQLDGKEFHWHKLPSLYQGHDLVIEVKSPVYEYQAIYKYNNEHIFSTGYYKDKEEFGKEYSNGTVEFVELYKPSKRVRC